MTTPQSLRLPEPWWKSARASTDEEAAAICKRLGTGQCAAICLSHLSVLTSDGKCPERLRVWGEKGEQ